MSLACLSRSFGKILACMGVGLSVSALSTLAEADDAIFGPLTLSQSGALHREALDAGQSVSSPLFGSNETYLGSTRKHLSPRRMLRLASTAGTRDPSAAHKWRVLVELLRNQPQHTQLSLVHQYFNGMDYVSDQELYNRLDYWATPEQFLLHGGDCEDFALTKYRALVDAGFPVGQLRIVLLEDRVTNDAHAVLAAYLDGEILILDNQRARVVSHNQIGHYK
ncbi:MAG: transglutaminase-like cysteine peptidase, partial [Pseudomonadota bacterium]